MLAPYPGAHVGLAIVGLLVRVFERAGGEMTVRGMESVPARPRAAIACEGSAL